MPSIEPPATNEIEVTLLGPGRGESCVVHLGSNEWLIVDSCRDQRTKDVAALSYLQSIGVDPSTQVKAIIATHAHDDHFDGIAHSVEICEQAQVWISSALTREEFFAHLAAENRTRSQIRKTAFDEYREIYRIADMRRAATGNYPLKRATESLVIYERSASEDAPNVRVDALSPSDLATTRAIKILAESVPKTVGESVRYAVVDPNECAIAVRISFGDVAILLGADLPVGPAGCGWEAVLATIQAPIRASLIKVPHHGSKTGDHDKVWTDLMAPMPIALVTPFRRGSVVVPSELELAQLRRHTPNTYLTAKPERPTPNKAAREARTTLMSLAKEVYTSDGLVGRVTARRKPTSSGWSVTAVSPAFRLH